MDDDQKYWIGYVVFIIVVFALPFWIGSIIIGHFGYIIFGCIVCAILLVGDIFSHFLQQSTKP
ncbi:hypothetical protein ACLUXJ_01490 [Lactobacillus porci]|uniref:hypothetical protein n=1 Tax=Lactobacillus porci TaxID=2012477 RepID=UPI0039925145